MSVEVKKLMQADNKGTQRQYYPETHIKAINGLEELLMNGDYPNLEKTISQFENNVGEVSNRLRTLKKDMTEMVDGEQDFLELEDGFENYNLGTLKGDVASQLQYVRVGPLCKIFGTVKNLETIKSGSEIAVATIPARLQVDLVDIVRGETREGHSFRCRAYNYNNPNFPNQITISDTRVADGSTSSFQNGKWLNISLIVGVDVK